jgi:aquaporin Z
MNKYGAEFFGTFWLVLGGCGSAVLAAAFPNVGIGLLGVSLAFGLTVLTMAYAIGHISGYHLNPAVSIGLWAGGRFRTSLVIILGATDKRAPQGFAPLAIGLGLTMIHLISIPVTNTSVNPARSTGVALLVGGWAVSQLWLFWVAPIAGSLLGAAVYRFIGHTED